MRLVGLTGGIGVGKSTVGDILEEQRIPVIRADAVGRELLSPQQPGFGPVVEAFGSEILDGRGMIDRRRLGKLIFADPLLRARIDGILHPLIRRRSHEIFEAFKERGADVVVYESALLFELGRDREMDQVILVTAPKDARIAWVCARDSLSIADVEQRMSSQIDEAIVLAQADYIIENDGSLNQLQRQTIELARRLIEIHMPNA